MMKLLNNKNIFRLCGSFVILSAAVIKSQCSNDQAFLLALTFIVP